MTREHLAQRAVRAAFGLAGTRALLGVVALAMPERAGRVWVGGGATGADRAVLLRALGGRDVALAVGALAGAAKGRRTEGDAGTPVQPLAVWVAMGAVSDMVDTLATAGGFSALPRRTRWLTLVASGGAAATGAAIAAALVQGARR